MRRNLAHRHCGFIWATLVVILIGVPISLATGACVSGSAEDFSLLDLSAGANVELLLTDPMGKRTGFDPKTQSDLTDIPDSSYTRDALEDDRKGTPLPDGAEFLTISHPLEGIYRLHVLGRHVGTYEISLKAFSQDQSRQPSVTVKGIAGPKSLSFFQINFRSKPGAVSEVARMATLESTLQDISNSHKLHLIKTSAVANSLTSKIKAASEAKARGDSTAAQNILSAFKNELRAQAGKHIDALPAQILREDADSLRRQFP